MKKIGIFFGSTTGNTEFIAAKIQHILGEDMVEVYNVSDIGKEDVEKYSNLIFGFSTWGISEMQDDIGDFLEILEKIDFTGKKVALFGLGDQSSYPDAFVDGIGVFYERIKELKGMKVVGMVSTEGYSFTASKAVINGKFVGLPLNEEYESNLSDERIRAWVEQLKNEFL